MPQVWGLPINQINKLIHHWDCKTKLFKTQKVNNNFEKRKPKKTNSKGGGGGRGRGRELAS